MKAQIEKIKEMFNKDVEELKNKQKEMENKITEMKNTLEGINSRIAKAEECISELEDRMVKSLPWSRVKKKRMKRNEDSLRHLWDDIKHTSIHIIGVLEGEEREKSPEKIFEEIITENFPNMGKETVIQV